MDELDEVGRVEDGEHGVEEVGDEANVHSYKQVQQGTSVLRSRTEEQSQEVDEPALSPTPVTRFAIESNHVIWGW